MSTNNPDLDALLAQLDRCLAALRTWTDVERITGKPPLALIADYRGNKQLLKRGTIQDAAQVKYLRDRQKDECRAVVRARVARRILEANGEAVADLLEALGIVSRPLRDVVRGQAEALGTAIGVLEDARAKYRGLLLARQLEERRPAEVEAPPPVAESMTPAKAEEKPLPPAPPRITFGVGTVIVEGHAMAEIPETDWLKILQGVAPEGRIGERVLLEDLARRVYAAKELQGLGDWKRALKARIDRLNDHLRTKTSTKLVVKTNLKAGWACLLWFYAKRAR